MATSKVDFPGLTKVPGIAQHHLLRALATARCQLGAFQIQCTTAKPESLGQATVRQEGLAIALPEHKPESKVPVSPLSLTPAHEARL